MVGEHIVEGERGKVIGTRVLPSEFGQGPRTELTFQSTGKILGFDFNNMATVESAPKAEGVLYAQGQGVVTTADGSMATWKFQGIVKPTGAGMAASFHGSVFFSTSSSKLARLNNICAVVSAQVDAAGTMTAELWEWT